MVYEYTKTIFSIESLTERLEERDFVEDGALDFSVLDNPAFADKITVVERNQDGIPTYVELRYPWHHDFTQTVIVRYQLVEPSATTEDV